MPTITSAEIRAYLEDCDMVSSGPLVILKSGKISNFYVDCRFLNWRYADGEYLHADILRRIGASIGEQARRLGVEMLVGVVTTGVTLARFASEASGIPCCTINPHKDNPWPSANLCGLKVMLLDDVYSTGTSITKVTPALEADGADIANVAVLVRRDDPRVSLDELELDTMYTEFLALLEIPLPIIMEKPDANSALLVSWLDPDDRSTVMRRDLGYAWSDGYNPEDPKYRYLPLWKWTPHKPNMKMR